MFCEQSKNSKIPCETLGFGTFVILVGNAREIRKNLYFPRSFGHSDELPSTFAVPIYKKKSLSLEPSKNDVVSGIRVQKFSRTTAASLAESMTYMGDQGHILTYMITIVIAIVIIITIAIITIIPSTVNPGNSTVNPGPSTVNPGAHEEGKAMYLSYPGAWNLAGALGDGLGDGLGNGLGDGPH